MKLHTECQDCGHSIPLGDTYCGQQSGHGHYCLNRYSQENEHPKFSHFDWRQAVAERSTDLGYHEWAEHQEESHTPELTERPKLTVKDMEIGIVGALVTAILKSGYSICVDNGGDEYEVTKSTDMTEVLMALHATSEEELILHHVKGDSPTAKRIGWFHLVYGNEGYTVIANYTDNAVVRALVEAVQPVVDRYERLSGDSENEATAEDREYAGDFSQYIVLSPGDPLPPMELDLP